MRYIYTHMVHTHTHTDEVYIYTHMVHTHTHTDEVYIYTWCTHTNTDEVYIYTWCTHTHTDDMPAVWCCVPGRRLPRLQAGTLFFWFMYFTHRRERVCLLLCVCNLY